ncbi:hypothetical protein Hdeb2414_s0011g00375461 [Helianthus debilis subsp. tardiflorus]
MEKQIYLSPQRCYPLLYRDPSRTIEDEAPSVSVANGPLWKLMCENPTCAFNFFEGLLAMGELSPVSSCYAGQMSMWNLLYADVMGVSFLYDGGRPTTDPIAYVAPNNGSPSIGRSSKIPTIIPT